MKSLWSLSRTYRQKNSVNVDFLYELGCTLRYSFAIYCLEQRTDIRYIQESLGHSSSKTTEIDTHFSTKRVVLFSQPKLEAKQYKKRE